MEGQDFEGEATMQSRKIMLGADDEKWRKINPKDYD